MSPGMWQLIILAIIIGVPVGGWMLAKGNRWYVRLLAAFGALALLSMVVGTAIHLFAPV